MWNFAFPSSLLSRNTVFSRDTFKSGSVSSQDTSISEMALIPVYPVLLLSFIMILPVSFFLGFVFFFVTFFLSVTVVFFFMFSLFGVKAFGFFDHESLRSKPKLFGCSVTNRFPVCPFVFQVLSWWDLSSAVFSTKTHSPSSCNQSSYFSWDFPCPFLYFNNHFPKFCVLFFWSAPQYSLPSFHCISAYPVHSSECTPVAETQVLFFLTPHVWSYVPRTTI